jgi:D-alanyl-D-alanine carboxypeptidase
MARYADTVIRRTVASRSRCVSHEAAVLVVMLLVGGCASGQATTSVSATAVQGSASPVPPSAASASAAAVATPRAVEDVLDEIITSTAGTTGAGVSAAVIDPSVSWEGFAGAADADFGRPLTTDTTLAMASVTKAALAALALRLAEQGELDLDAPIERYLPDDLSVDTNGATVREALAHRSGIGEHTSSENFFVEVLDDPERTWTAREVLEFAGPPDFEAGEGWAYSNTNYVLAALAIEEVTGEPVGAVMRRELLDPAGLDRMVYQPDEPPVEPLAVGQTNLDGTGGSERIEGGDLLPTRAFATAAGGAGGMAADAPSLARWGAALYGGQVLSPDSLEQMLAFEQAEGGHYGLGTERVTLPDGTTAVGHSGLIPGFSSGLLYVPDKDRTAAVLVNSDAVDAMAIARRLLDAMDEAS